MQAKIYFLKLNPDGFAPMIGIDALVEAPRLFAKCIHPPGGRPVILAESKMDN
jgi:hypothetical protein